MLTITHCVRATATGLVCLAVALTAQAQGSKSKGRSCPPGMRPSIGGCVEGAPARIRLTPGAEAASKLKAVRATAPRSPDVDADALRAPVLEHHSRRLLTRELVRLEALLRSTPRGSPDRAQIVKRLAEGYAELALLAERERMAAELAAEQAERERKARPRRQTPTPYPTKL